MHSSSNAIRRYRGVALTLFTLIILVVQVWQPGIVNYLHLHVQVSNQLVCIRGSSFTVAIQSQCTSDKCTGHALSLTFYTLFRLLSLCGMPASAQRQAYLSRWEIPPALPLSNPWSFIVPDAYWMNKRRLNLWYSHAWNVWLCNGPEARDVFCSSLLTD